MIDECITYLSAYDSEISECMRDFSYDRTLSYTREEFESYGLECITHEYRHSLSILFPYRRFSSAKCIIIHSRKVIMDERIRMDTLYTEECFEKVLWSILLYGILICETCEDRTETLSGSFQ